MKKVLTLLITVALIFSFSACGTKNSSSEVAAKALLGHWHSEAYSDYELYIAFYSDGSLETIPRDSGHYSIVDGKLKLTIGSNTRFVSYTVDTDKLVFKDFLGGGKDCVFHREDWS